MLVRKRKLMMNFKKSIWDKTVSCMRSSWRLGKLSIWPPVRIKFFGN